MGNLEAMETEIAELEENIRDYDRRKSNLLQAIEWGEFEKDEILDRLNTLRGLYHQDETKLQDLLRTRNNITNLAEAKIRLGQLYDRVMDNLHNATPEIIRLALDALDIKVYASTERVEIRGVIPLALPTIEQTSA